MYSSHQSALENSLKPHVLFLDDEPNYLSGIQRTLRHMRADWDMTFVSNPHEALNILRNTNDVVVVTDWMMPEMDGLRFFQEARLDFQEKQHALAYFIVLTGKQGADDLVTALDAGFDDFIRKPFHTGELVARVRVGLRVLKSERALQTANMKLETLASTDPLTGLYNRRHGVRVMQEEMSRVQRGKQHISVIMADIDHFKRINDTFGHAAGDRVLEQFATTLKFTLRNYDVAVRWGGEEFLLICPHTSSTEVDFVTDRLMRNIREMNIGLENGTSIRVTASLGTCSTDLLTAEEATDLVGKADRMMYLAKTEGRNRVFHFRVTPMS